MAKEAGGRAVQADVSDPEQAKRLVEEAGDLDILVNNAGLTRDGVLARMTDDDWRAVIETNLSSVFYTCRAVTRGMMKKRAGSIVNVSSIVGVHGNWGQTNYGASKAGIIGFTKSLARELGSRGVRANVVAPGYVNTRLTDVLPEEAQQAMLANTPLGRLGEPEDVAGAVRFLCSDEASFITGEVLLVDGGIGDVMTDDEPQRTTQGRDHGPRRGDPTRQRRRDRPGRAWSPGAQARARSRSSTRAEFAVHFACEVKDFDPTEYIDRKQARRMDRFAHLIVAAARQAEADSGLEIEPEADRVGAAIATGIGGLKAFQDCHSELLERGPDRVNPFSIPEIIPNMGAAWVSMQLGTKGPLSSQCTACAASNMAIGDGLDAIRLGRADVMLCGGTEAPVTEVGIAGFSAMRALSRRNDDPEQASRPFDAERDGFVMGEAGAVLVLEELEHAQARGAKIYAELLGYGVSSDARHITEPDPTGVNPARAMTMAFGDAGGRSERDRLHQRARHLDAARRRERDAGDQARARRGERAQDAGLLDEGRDRPLPRRGRRGRGDVHDPRGRARRAAADDQLRGAGSRVRPRLHPERGARGRTSRGGVELVRLRRAQRIVVFVKQFED